MVVGLRIDRFSPNRSRPRKSRKRISGACFFGAHLLRAGHAPLTWTDMNLGKSLDEIRSYRDRNLFDAMTLAVQ